MKMNLCCDVISRLQGKTLVTAESLTGGGIGAAITEVPGSSAVYKGGVICYTDAVKNTVLGVPEEILREFGAVSAQTARHMAFGVRRLLHSDIAVSVTGLAGPGGDEYGNPVGTVFIGYEDQTRSEVHQFIFSGNREAVRNQTVEAALKLILDNYHISDS